MKAWESYEQVAAYLIGLFAAEFDLKSVGSKQHIAGEISGTPWEIDAKGIHKDGDGFVIIECKRYTTSKISQETVAGLAYRIHDTGAKGGIIVTPLGLQSGAELVAAAGEISSVTLTEDSTRLVYFMQFLNKLMMGVNNVVSVSDSVRFVVIDLDGNVVSEG